MMTILQVIHAMLERENIVINKRPHACFTICIISGKPRNFTTIKLLVPMGTRVNLKP